MDVIRANSQKMVIQTPVASGKYSKLPTWHSAEFIVAQSPGFQSTNRAILYFLRDG